VAATFTLDSATYPDLFPKAVVLEYTVTLAGSSLTTALKAVNPKDSDVEIRLKTFYHNYIAVSDAQMISVTGLKSGLQYKDTLKGGEIGSWDGSELKMNARIGK
jgi:D-hexose-6-phosphate mutarotase